MTSRTKTGVAVRFIGEDRAKLLENLTVELDNFIFCLEAGFVSDGASVPQILWSFGMDAWSYSTLEGALIHDALYSSEMVYRHEADEIFYRILRKDGNSLVKSYIYWLGVRLFGWIEYLRHTKRTVNRAKKLLWIVER